MDKLITYKIYNKSELSKGLSGLIKFLKGYNTDFLEESLNKYLKELRDDLNFLIEYPYVDKPYRDMYYFYYSTKHGEINRNCIRISIYSNNIEHDVFFDSEKIKYLKDIYLGTMVIRPTYKFMVGRSMISPKAFKHHEFYCRTTKIESSIRGIKLEIDAFPHFSQDSETMTCAETTVWCTMEYFGTTYPEYRTILPSKIIQTLSQFTFERQVPSKGLTIAQISYALKELGFSSKIYHDEIDTNALKRLLHYYVESGIPVIAAIDMNKLGFHAVIFNGHGRFNPGDISNLQESYKEQLKDSGLIVYDSADLKKELVVIDDNYPPYRLSDFDDPLKYWNDLSKFDIIAFVVPLYSKVYLEAYQARNAILHILSKWYPKHHEEKELILRLFLASSRSFKNSIIQNQSLDKSARMLVGITAMPKFIWVGEISTKEYFSKEKIVGFIVIDATETNFSKSLIMAIFPKIGIIYNNDNQIQEISLNLNPFHLYTSNLNNYSKNAGQTNQPIIGDL